MVQVKNSSNVTELNLADGEDNNDNDGKHDLTRIEDLSEFMHSEDDDDFSDLDKMLDPSLPDLPTEDESESDLESQSDFSDQATDPNMELPEEFSSNDNSESENIDFTSMEDNESFESTDDSGGFQSEELGSSEFGSDEFGSDESESNEFGSDEFGSDEFGSDEFGADEFGTNDFTSDATEDQIEDETEFAPEEITEFDSEEPSGFESTDFDSNEFNSNEFNNEELGEEESPTTTPEETIPEETIPEETIPEETILEDTIQEEMAPAFDTLPEQEATIAPEFSAEASTEKTEIIREEKQEAFKPPENFKELQNFAKNISYGNLAQEGNPPFSIVIKDIKFKEDLEDVLTLLSEYKIIQDDDLESARSSLERGNMLIPRLGEFAAITLCHNLRKFNLNILMGLTEEIHPAKSYESNDQGLVSKSSVYSNHSHHYHFENKEVSIQDMITATTPYLEGYDIVEYLKVVTETIIIDMDHFIGDRTLEEELINVLPSEIQDQQVEKSISQENIQATNSDLVKDFFPSDTGLAEQKNKLTLSDIYSSLIEKLKAQALTIKGNAIIGINFQVTPILASENLLVNSKYQVTCSGNIVWVNRR